MSAYTTLTVLLDSPVIPNPEEVACVLLVHPEYREHVRLPMAEQKMEEESNQVPLLVFMIWTVQMDFHAKRAVRVVPAKQEIDRETVRYVQHLHHKERDLL